MKYRYGNNLTPFGVEINELEIHRKQDIAHRCHGMYLGFQISIEGNNKSYIDFQVSERLTFFIAF